MNRMVGSLGVSLGAVLLVLLISAGGAELYLRKIEPNPPLNPSLRRTEILGWDSIPPVEEISTGNTGDTILFVGDSFTKDVQWTKSVAANLKDQKGGVNAYSLGVPGYGTIQEYLKLRDHIRTYQPKKVVLLFNAWNDLRDNWNAPGIYYNYESLSRPMYNFSNAQPQPQLKSPLLTPSWRFYSRIYQRYVLQPLVESCIKEGAEFTVDEMTERTIRIPLYYSDERGWVPFYRPEAAESPYVTAAWNATEYALRQIKDLCDQNGAQLLLVGIDNPFSADQDVYEQYVKVKEGFESGLPLRRLGEVSQKLSIRYINAQPALVEEHKKVGKKLYNEPAGNLSGHFEPEGERVIANLVSEALLPKE